MPHVCVATRQCQPGSLLCRRRYTTYLSWLREGAERHGCLIHAYVLMTNHVHLLLTPQSRDFISRRILFHGRKHVGYIHHRNHRSGALWEGRHKGAVIESSAYALACSQYVELNPVRASMVDTTSDYRWSSYRENAFHVVGQWLTPTREYMALCDELTADIQGQPIQLRLPGSIGEHVNNAVERTTNLVQPNLGPWILPQIRS